MFEPSFWYAHWPLVVRLGVKDLLHEWRVSAALMLAIVSVLAPLLLLFGLKTGVVETLRDLLLRDPRNMEVIIFENTKLSRAWFTGMRANPEVRFVIPRTRTLNTSVDLEGPGRRFLPDKAEVIPTGTGDPLLPPSVTPPAQPTEVLLSHAAAASLEVESGAHVKAWLQRVTGGKEQAHAVELTVAGIVPERAYSRPAVFASLEFLEGVEDFVEGHAAPALGADAGEVRPEPRKTYASARLYARTLEGVASLADRLRAGGLEVRTRSEDIARMQAADDLLNRVLGLIAMIAVIGGSCAFSGAIWITIERKRVSLALLRLLGLRGGQVVAFTLCEALAVGSAAFVSAYLLFLVGAEALNRYSAGVFFDLLGARDTGGAMCRLQVEDALLAAVLTLAFATLTALAGALHAKSIEPGECIRET